MPERSPLLSVVPTPERSEGGGICFRFSIDSQKSTINNFPLAKSSISNALQSAKRLMTTPPPTLWTRGGLSLWQLFRNICRAIVDDDLIGRASGLAFNTLLAFFPMLLFLLALFGAFASRSELLEARFLLLFAPVLPPAAFQLLRQVVKELSVDPSGHKLSLTIVLALWFASGGISSMISTLNLTYRVPDSRSWLKIRLIALGLTLVLTVLLLFSLFTVLAGAHVVDWWGSALDLESSSLILAKAIQWPLALVFLMVSFSLIYYFGPDIEQKRWHWVTPGSLAGVLLWLAASGCFRLYLHYFNTYSTSYGSLAAVMILLVWMYVSGLAFLIGSEIDAEIGRTLAIPARLTV
jgi:membrane protein